MTNLPEIKDFEYSLTVTHGAVTLDNYDILLKEATMLADYLGQIEVTEESLADGKRLVAKVRKKVNALDDIRKDLRREFLKPVNALADRIATINKIVTDAEDRIRSQIRGLEEERREAKKAELKRIFDLRAARYRDSGKYMGFDRFLQAKHLNKSVSIDSVEREMVDYMENVNKDVRFLGRMSPSDRLNEALTLYAVSGDAQGALESVADRPALSEPEVEEPLTRHITVYERDLPRAEKALREAGVEFWETVFELTFNN